MKNATSRLVISTVLLLGLVLLTSCSPGDNETDVDVDVVDVGIMDGSWHLVEGKDPMTGVIVKTLFSNTTINGGNIETQISCVKSGAYRENSYLKFEFTSFGVEIPFRTRYAWGRIKINSNVKEALFDYINSHVRDALYARKPGYENVITYELSKGNVLLDGNVHMARDNFFFEGVGGSVPKGILYGITFEIPTNMGNVIIEVAKDDFLPLNYCAFTK